MLPPDEEGQELAFEEKLPTQKNNGKKEGHKNKKNLEEEKSGESDAQKLGETRSPVQF